MTAQSGRMRKHLLFTWSEALQQVSVHVLQEGGVLSNESWIAAISFQASASVHGGILTLPQAYLRPDSPTLPPKPSTSCQIPVQYNLSNKEKPQFRALLSKEKLKLIAYFISICQEPVTVFFLPKYTEAVTTPKMLFFPLVLAVIHCRQIACILSIFQVL